MKSSFDLTSVGFVFLYIFHCASVERFDSNAVFQSITHVPRSKWKCSEDYLFKASNLLNFIVTSVFLLRLPLVHGTAF